MTIATPDPAAGGRRTGRAGTRGRTCVACGRSAPAEDLLRVIASPDGALVLDWRRRLGGRGGHVCATRTCLERAVERRGFDRALHARPAYPAAEELVRAARLAFERRIETLLRSARGAGALVAGHDAVEAALQRGRLRCLVAAADSASAGRLVAAAERAGVPAAAAFDKARLGGLLGRGDTGVIGIADEGLARALCRGMAGLGGLR